MRVSLRAPPRAHEGKRLALGSAGPLPTARQPGQMDVSGNSLEELKKSCSVLFSSSFSTKDMDGRGSKLGQVLHKRRHRF